MQSPGRQVNQTRINQAPPLPWYYVERPEVSQRLKQILLSQETARAGTLVVSAIYGLGGIGKSTLAAALAHDKEVQSHFTDGIFWASLGQQPDILSFISTWIQALKDYDLKPINTEAASLQLRTLLSDKKALLVVDDVWHPDHVEPFRVAGGGCRVLVTTREAPVNGAIRYDLNVMTLNQSLELLTGCLQLFSDESTSLPLAASPLNPPILGDFNSIESTSLPLAASPLNPPILGDFNSIESTSLPLAASPLNPPILGDFNSIESTSLPLAASPLNPPILGDFNSSSPQNWGARGAKIAVNNHLTNQELDYAKTLAKTVGYLPLALELAATQVRDGFSWQELLDELQAEIADLEALDRLEAEEEPSDAKRKNYSLVASFNLSLKRLSPERLKKFAWLGVLPENVTISATMATTLWDCTSFQAKKTLIVLRQKALLLPGFSSTPQTSYRLHDLLHDLARNLLQPELGLSITEAHQQLLERYQTKTDLGLWHTLPDDGYIYNYLTWHLEKAQKIDEIHQLLKEETAEGDNGWYWQCDRQGKTANFVKDVSRAWAIAAAKFIENPTQSISLQCRYALITTSFNSLARNIPPELMAALLKNKIWTPAQALAYVRQIKDYKRQAKGLEGISKYLTPSLLPEALDCARGISDEYHRAHALVALAPHLPDVLPEALDCARRIKYEYSRAKALIALAPHLPQVLLHQALDCARRIRYKYDRAKALIALAPHLPQVLPEALDCARRISDEYERALALIGLASHLPDVLPEALDSARRIGHEYYRALALISLAPQLPQVLPKALDCATGISDEYERALALIGLAPHLAETLLLQALEAARGIGDKYDRADALIALAPQLPQVLQEALDCARRIGSEYDRADALIGLAPHLPQVLQEALDCARGIGSEYDRADALIGLAPHLSEVLLHQALDSARGIGYESHRARALIGLAPHLSEVLLHQALDSARGIGYESHRARALVGLAPHLPDVLLQALDSARALEFEYDRADALHRLIQRLTPSSVDFPFWQQTLDGLASLRRRNFLRALPQLAPLIIKFGGIEALRETVAAVDDVSRWWR
ncbi:hypothetical protein BJP34_21160 [Moorena producens PAL-8-15-08-1]|uniref:NB-ARC domain-containing protein n=1 Tax=Moorena producens PAL-8-15-08-1 TaxID=1458985 RepID=A0A1D8TVK3_9CYAN|nr:NB-ARC domain-containing protein [Moorena producens]AOX01614.1 hypothetical protein BJP34_21160 [Moorena producens PAL-8-15-08-1]